jgi:hypothetical protein
MFVTTAVGWAVRAKGSRINSLILLAIGALLLPLFSSVVLVQMEWLEGLQTDQREVFARYMDRDANGRRLDSGMLSPTNLQIAVATGITVAYCLVLVRVTRALVAWAGIAVYLFYSAVLLRLGLKEWLMHEHVARALVAYLPLTLAFGIGGVLLRRWSKRDWLGAVTFAFFPFPAVACLSALAWFGAVEWLHVAADRKEPVINLLWMLDGVIYFVVALLFCRSRIGFVRFWGPLLMLVVSAHLSGPPNQRFNQDGLFMLGQAEVTFWELLALLVALMLAVVGTWLRLHTLAIPGLVSMVIFLLQATWRHFDHALAWPVALLAIGGSAMVISAILLVWRSRRAHEAIM